LKVKIIYFFNFFEKGEPVQIEENEEFFDGKKSIKTESVYDPTNNNNEDAISEMSRKGKNVADKFKNSLPSDLFKRREYSMATAEKKNSIQIENEENEGN
jgi:hypothetical protein